MFRLCQQGQGVMAAASCSPLITFVIAKNDDDRREEEGGVA